MSVVCKSCNDTGYLFKDKEGNWFPSDDTKHEPHGGGSTAICECQDIRLTIDTTTQLLISVSTDNVDSFINNMCNMYGEITEVKIVTDRKQ